MNLRSIDLNLLVVLDALLDERHVSRAALRLGMSQPAASNALARLRHLFGDPLLERTAAGMVLTPRAEAARGPLKTLLAGVTGVLDPPPPDPRSLRQVVRMVMADMPAREAIVPLLERLAETAPGIDLVIQPWRGPARTVEALRQGDADLALAVVDDPDPDIVRMELFREHYRAILRRDHPAAGRLTLENWLEWPHVMVSGRSERRSHLDDRLAERGLKRRVGIVVPSFLAVPEIVARSDMIALLPSTCLPENAGSGFCVCDPPLEMDGFMVDLTWHRRNDADPAIRHVAGLIRGIIDAAHGDAAASGDTRVPE